MDRAWAGSPGDGERLEPCRDLSINSQRDISQRVHGQRFVIGVNCGGRGFNEVESATDPTRSSPTLVLIPLVLAERC